MRGPGAVWSSARLEPSAAGFSGGPGPGDGFLAEELG